MAKATRENHKDKDLAELNELLKAKKAELQKLTQEILKNKEKNVMKLGFLRKEIARIQTARQEKIILDKKE